MGEKQQREYWQIYVDTWKLLKFFFDHGGSDGTMERFVDIARNLYRKYEHLELGKKMILDTIDEVSRINREGLFDGQTGKERSSS